MEPRSVYTLWSNQLFSLSPGPDTTVKGPHSTDKLMFLQGYTNYFFVREHGVHAGPKDYFVVVVVVVVVVIRGSI
jgi:hypothetical protein